MRLTTTRSQRAGPGLGRIRSPLTYANVMATIAVFGMLTGGGAYAASKIGSKDIAKNAVRAKHIKKNHVRAKHIKPGHVRTRHILDGTVTAEKLAEGVEGLQGEPGPQGLPGPQGPPGPTPSAAASSTDTVEIMGFGQNTILEAEITLATESRLLALGTVTLEGEGGDDDEAVCRIRDGTDRLGATTLTTIPDTKVDTMGMSVSGAAVRPAGTHTVELTCNKGNGQTNFDVIRSNLLVWAAAV